MVEVSWTEDGHVLLPKTSCNTSRVERTKGVGEWRWIQDDQSCVKDICLARPTTCQHLHSQKPGRNPIETTDFTLLFLSLRDAERSVHGQLVHSTTTNLALQATIMHGSRQPLALVPRTCCCPPTQKIPKESPTKTMKHLWAWARQINLQSTQGPPNFNGCLSSNVCVCINEYLTTFL